LTVAEEKLWSPALIESPEKNILLLLKVDVKIPTKILFHYSSALPSI